MFGLHPGRWAHSAEHLAGSAAGEITRPVKAVSHDVGHVLEASAKDVGRVAKAAGKDAASVGRGALKLGKDAGHLLEKLGKDLYCNAATRQLLAEGAGAGAAAAAGAPPQEGAKVGGAVGKALPGCAHKQAPTLSFLKRSVDDIERFFGLHLTY